MTFVLGLTGGIATGKSTVSQYLANKGIPIVDADLIARQVVEPGTSGLATIVNEFGEELLLPDGTLNRKLLGQVVFNDSVKRHRLDTILDNDIRREIKSAIAEAVAQNSELVIVDIPLLFEAGYEAFVDQIMVVSLPPDLQVERLMKRNQLTKIEAEKRIASQMAISSKVVKADFVIDNSGTVEQTYQQIDQWLNQMKKSLV